MPDLDGAHGFLTVLMPLNVAPCERADLTITSPAHAVRELLAALPTAQHSPVCAASGRQSPFARSGTTHFARFAVLDAPAFNGRERQDAVRASLPGGADPLADPSVDQLSRPYLMFFADFDRQGPAARPDPRAPAQAYLEGLWTEAPELWSALLDHCDAAPGAGSRTARSFGAYMLARRVETTMPFNDYGVGAASPTGGAPPIAAPLALAVAIGLFAAGLARALLGGGVAGWLLAGLLGLSALAGSAAWAIARWGRRSAPWSGGTDLATVLKSLHLQAAFARFVIDHQGASDDALHADFLAFAQAQRPADLEGPTQAPGIVPQ